MTAKKITFIGLMTACAMVTAYFESMLPPIGIPGVKPGLANAVSLFLLLRYSYKEAALVSFVRVVLSAFMFTNLFSMVYALTGAALSIIIMAVLKKTGRFSAVSISAAGGVFHNIGQLAVAAAVLENVRTAYYLPVLILSGAFCGVLVGILASCLQKYIPSR